MIVLYGIRTEALPEAEYLKAWIGPEWLSVWQERHPKLQREASVKQSLGALSLLRCFGRGGALSYERSGRPCLDGSPGGFSLAHTDSHCFCAVSGDDLCVGVDAEDVCGREPDRLNAIGNRWFAAGEKGLFAEKPVEERFLEIWTRKEALSKYLGTGIAAAYREDTVRLAAEKRLYFQTIRKDQTVISVCTSEPSEAGDVLVRELSVFSELRLPECID